MGGLIIFGKEGDSKKIKKNVLLTFKDKTAIVTGSGMGIGRAIAQELCRQGARVVLNSRNAERLEKTRLAFLENGYHVIAVKADVTNIQECEELIRKTIEAFGKIDILIANAGVSMRDHFENTEPEVFTKIIESNIQGSAFPALKALPFIKNSKGSIVFISSIAGLVGLPTASAYSAGKMALTALAQSLKIELSGTGVHIGIVYVGFTENDADKRTLTATGELIPVENRPAYLQQSQQQVAKAVLDLIVKRKFKSVLSFIGKLSALALRFFPGIVLSVISYSQKRMKNIQHAKK